MKCFSEFKLHKQQQVIKYFSYTGGTVIDQLIVQTIWRGLSDKNRVNRSYVTPTDKKVLFSIPECRYSFAINLMKKSIYMKCIIALTESHVSSEK